MDTLRDKNQLEELWAVGHGARGRSGRDARRSGAAGASSSPATPASRAAGSRSGCTRSAREVTGFALGAADRAVAASSWRGVGETRRGRRVGDIRDARRARARGRRRRGPRSSSTSPRSRSCARSLRRPGRDLRDQRDGHGPRARGRAARAGSVRAVRRSSPPTSATRTASGSGATARTSRWAATIPTAAARAAAELVTARLPALVLRRRGGGRARHRARRQRDRRRRLGRGPARPRHHARARSPASRSRVRNPDAIRPWQHVLEPLSGYLRARRRRCGESPAHAAGWNFGPADERRAAGRLDRRAPRPRCGPSELRWELDDGAAPARGALPASSTPRRARTRLGWRPRLGPRRGARARSSTGTARCATAPTCAPSRSAQIEAFSVRCRLA